MSSEQKRKPHEVWDALEKMAIHDEAERVGALNDQELDDELAKKGLDPSAVRARGAALAAKMKAKVPTPAAEVPVRGRPSTRKRWIAVLAAATLAAAALTASIPVVVAVARHEEIGRFFGGERFGATRQEEAARLRRSARDTCAQHRWVDCRRALDDAQGLDPQGEESPEVKRMRRDIGDALNPPQSPPAPEKK
jgi:hypothetical protein